MTYQTVLIPAGRTFLYTDENTGIRVESKTGDNTDYSLPANHNVPVCIWLCPAGYRIYYSPGIIQKAT